MKPLAALWLGPLLLPLAACGSGDDAPRNRTAPTPLPTTDTGATVTDKTLPPPIKPRPTAGAETGAGAGAEAGAGAVLSCSAERGRAAAATLVKTCIAVSPATHPPCNAANSCAIIEDEIARSCALIGDAAATTPGCTVDPKSAAAAANVVRRYYSAINAHDYATAWTQWGPDGRPGQRFADFQRGFAQTRATRVTIGPLPPIEGAAGSAYATIPVTVDAQTNTGLRQQFAGQYVVRRVNDVPGASADQLRWHIESATLKPVR